MTDFSAAIAAAREELDDHYTQGGSLDPQPFRDLLAALAAAQGEAVAWPKADDSDKELGWSWDYKWLESLADATRAAGWDASMEAIDFVLSRVAAPQATPAADYAGDAGPATDDDFVDLPAAVPAGYDEDEIADACIMAEVSDSKYEAIITYLGDNRRRAAARKGE